MKAKINIMQSKNYDETFGKVLKYSPIRLRELLEEKETERVEVFKATKKERENHNKFHMGKRFQKVPKIKR